MRCSDVPGRDRVGQTGGASLLLGAQDADAHATLAAALANSGWETRTIGPVTVVLGVRGRLDLLGALLTQRLSRYTRRCIRAAVAPRGIEIAEDALSAFVLAEPLDELLRSVPHEWVRTALAENWLFSVFHPIVDPHAGAVFAQEALIRARDPETGEVHGAGKIIDACAALNLHHQLDQRARRSAIRSAAQHVADDQKVFINFLPNTIYDPEICLRTTMEAAGESGLDPGRLVFEVVETQQIPDMKRLCHILDYYRARGVGTAVDDMGAGYTSVEYIAALRPDFVKLDRELMVEAEHDRMKRLKVDLMIAASHGHGARVIAEGIETDGQLRMCLEAGVDLVQGFYFARPASPPQQIRWASARRAAA